MQQRYNNYDEAIRGRDEENNENLNDEMEDVNNLPWLKVPSTSLIRDNFLVKLRQKFGIEGFGIWIGILLLIADSGSGTSITLPWSSLLQYLGMSGEKEKLIEVLEFAQAYKEPRQRLVKLEFQDEGEEFDCVTITVPPIHAVIKRYLSARKRGREYRANERANGRGE